MHVFVNRFKEVEQHVIMFGLILSHAGTILNHPEPCSYPMKSVGKTMIYASV